MRARKGLTSLSVTRRTARTHRPTSAWTGRGKERAIFGQASGWAQRTPRAPRARQQLPDEQDPQALIVEAARSSIPPTRARRPPRFQTGHVTSVHESHAGRSIARRSSTGAATHGRSSPWLCGKAVMADRGLRFTPEDEARCENGLRAEPLGTAQGSAEFVLERDRGELGRCVSNQTTCDWTPIRSRVTPRRR